MPGKKNYRLFQVAKELNVGTSMLVEHLQEKGHDIDNSPNTKISPDLYNELLRKFASEKQIKEKAQEVMIDKRQIEEEENGVAAPVKTEKSIQPDDAISAQSLRESINGPAPVTVRRKRKSANNPPTPIEELKKTALPEEPVVETPQAKVEPPTPKPEEPAKPETPGLRIMGKVDLDKIQSSRPNKRGGKGDRNSAKPQAKANAPVKKPQPPKTSPEPAVEKPKPVAKQVEKVEQPAPPEPKTTPVAKAEPVAPPAPEKPEAPTPEAPTPAPEKVPATPEAPVTPEAKTPPATPPPKEEVVDQEAEKPVKEEEVIRAGDNAQKLRGLKVMGKIELPSDRKGRKKKENEKKKEEPKKAAPSAKKPEDKSNKSGEEGSDADKKKRRRRRRKRKGGEGAGTPNAGNNNQNNKSGSGNDNKRRGKAEKPSAKEVDASIRNTMSQMGQGASRQRQRLRRAKRDADAARREELERLAEEQSRVLEVTEFITANEFAELIKVPVNDVITKSFMLGMMISINQRLDAELLTILAEEYGYELNFVDVSEGEFEIIEEEDSPEDLVPRTPIITVMGHVDHGKTTLLDNLRKANVAAGEAGGITQHIGAYKVKLEDDSMVTFLDTPGHEAFTAMRARGAQVTDVVIIVIAADDAVMPQTKEAINHAQVAEVPMVFAFNKIDKAGADPEKIKAQLAEMNLLVEDWGGKFQSQDISALKGMNVEDLLEKVILESEILELKANPKRSAAGTVIEARLDRGRGNVATFLVQNGTLKVGDEFVAGIHYGRVRALIDQNGNRVDEAGPSTPVQVLGLTGQPTAGDKFYVFTEDGKAKDISQKRQELYREQQMRRNNRLTLEEIGRRRALGNFKELNIIIRADVDGSVEALAGSLMKLSTEEVQVNIIWKGVGAISEADINLAIASDAIVLAFNVRPNGQARALAEREDVDIRQYSVIYDAIDDVRDALEGLLSPELREEHSGNAEVREVFRISKVGNVAGCLVTNGKVIRDNPVRVIRDGVVIHEGQLSSLKRFKDDAKEVASGLECGIMIENYNDIEEGDIIESFKVNEIRRKLAR